MEGSRRHFLKQLASIVSVLVGGTQLAGCLGESAPQQDAMPQPEVQSSTGASGSATSSSSGQSTANPPSQNAPNQNTPNQNGPTQSPGNAGPVWQGSPTIDFVEGVPATVSIRDFVSDPNSDPLVLTLNSGTLPPGITWNPSNATLAYDGRPLGAKPEAPVVVPGVTFAADDLKV